MANLLPLESFRQILGYNPWHFWGLADTVIVPVTSACNTLMTRYSWQNVDAAGREDIRQAIETAEERLREYLGYSVAPRYTEATVQWPKYHDRRLWRSGWTDAYGRFISVRLPEGKIRAIGVEQLTLIDTVAVTYADNDGDGLDESFSLSFPTTVTNPEEIVVYFTTSDRWDNTPAGDEWAINPVTVTIAGGTATVVGKAWLLVRPVLYEGADADNAIDPNVAGNFVTDVDVYRRTTNMDGETAETAQAVLLWEAEPCHGWFCCCSDCSSVDYGTASRFDPAASGMALGRAGIRDADSGRVIPAHALRNSTSGIWTSAGAGYRDPDRVKVRYLAGEFLANGQMAPKWRTLVARLAAAELGRRACGCDFANRELYHWQFDLARAAGSNDEQYSISQADLDNPFGTRRGQVYTWKQVRHLRRGDGRAMN